MSWRSIFATKGATCATPDFGTNTFKQTPDQNRKEFDYVFDYHRTEKRMTRKGLKLYSNQMYPGSSSNSVYVYDVLFKYDEQAKCLVRHSQVGLTLREFYALRDIGQEVDDAIDELYTRLPEPAPPGLARSFSTTAAVTPQQDPRTAIDFFLASVNHDAEQEEMDRGGAEEEEKKMNESK